jgi:hypothetical protein
MRIARPAAVLALLAACNHLPTPLRVQDWPEAATRIAPTAPAAPDASADQRQSVTLGGAGNAEAKSGGAAGLPQSGIDLPPGTAAPADAMIVRTGNASIEVATLDPAVTALRELARRAGGYVGATAVQAGRDQSPSATIELRVPSARFDELVTGLRPLGRVEYVNVAAEDVGEEFVDVTARVANAHKLEERLVGLLATRTGKLSDVLTVERELARVREEIERYEGRLRYLRARSAMSTLSVTVHEPRPLVGEPGANPMADAVRAAWRNALAVVAAGIAGAGYLAPLALLAVSAIFLLRRFRFRSSDAR